MKSTPGMSSNNKPYPPWRMSADNKTYIYHTAKVSSCIVIKRMVSSIKEISSWENDKEKDIFAHQDISNTKVNSRMISSMAMVRNV